MKFGLTEEQLVARRAGIGGSDAQAVITGGEEWVKLWLDKTGRQAPKAIMSEWDSALRHCTEGLQADWYEHTTGREVFCRGQVEVWESWPVLRCTLDGFIYELRTVFQAKHVSDWTKEPIRWCLEHYSAQVQHEMLVTNAESAILAIMVGMKEPEFVPVERDPFFQEAYVERCREFWSYVESDTAPPGYVEPISGPSIDLSAMKEMDFSESNSWGDLAGKWLEDADAAKRFKDTERAIKEMVPQDVKLATGYGIICTRNRANALSIKRAKQGPK